MEALGWFLEAERGRFTLWLPAALGAAILFYFALPTEPPLWAGLAGLAVGLAALAAGWRYPPAKFAAALLLAAAIGFSRATLHTAAQPPLLTIQNGAAELTGTVAALIPLPDGRKIILATPTINGAPQPRALKIRLRADDPAPLATGDRVTLYAMLFRPDRPAYPGAWDASLSSFYSGLGGAGFALGTVSVTKQAPLHDDAVSHLRAGIAANIAATLPPATSSIAITLLTGDQQQIPPAEHQAFIAAGLAHILAVAGLHVGIVMGIFFTVTRFVLSRSEHLALHWPVKAIAAVAALAGGAGYAALTGAHLPILRSLAMASLVTLGVLAGRRAISLRGLALAAGVLLLASPENVLGVSFQMSFSAVLALISGYAAAQKFFARVHHKILHHVLSLAFTSLLAGGASMPFAAYQFQEIEPYWIPANLIAVPLTAFWIMPLGMAALALMPLGLGWLALIPMGWGIAIMVWITAQVATWPDALFAIPLVPAGAMLAYSAGLLWLCLWRSRVRLAGLPLMALAIWLCMVQRPPDALVSADARLIAVHSGANVFVLRSPKASTYTLAQWHRVWPGAVFESITCGPLGCPFGPLLITTKPMCNAALLISPAILHTACRHVDLLSAWAQGATAVWLSGTLLTDRDVQGTRPWVPPWPLEK